MVDNFESEIFIEDKLNFDKNKGENNQNMFFYIDELDKNVDNHQNNCSIDFRNASYPTYSKLNNTHDKNFYENNYPQFGSFDKEIEYENEKNYQHFSIESHKKIDNNLMILNEIYPGKIESNYQQNPFGTEIKKTRKNENEYFFIKNLSEFMIREKEEKKDILGTYKIYEILYKDASGDLSLKCYRRYDNFYKFYIKITNEFPFLLIPRLPCKNALAKFIKIEQKFYDSRTNQLNHFLNFIKNNDHLSQSNDFKKFISNTEFDDDFFLNLGNSHKNFPYSLKISETIKNKILGVFNNIFGQKDNKHLPTSEEKIIKKMESHYKTMSEKYNDIKENMSVYFKSINKCSLGYKYISNTLLFMRDCVGPIKDNSELFNKYSEVSRKFSEVNQINYEKFAKIIEADFENFLNVLNGLCDLFDRYNEFLLTYDNVFCAKKYCFNNNMKNFDEIEKEHREISKLKDNFEKNIFEQVSNFDKNYSYTYNQMMANFVDLIKKINSEEFEILTVQNEDQYK